MNTDTETAASPPSSQEQADEKKSKNRSPMWILLSVIVGFALPVCSCSVLFFTGVVSLGMLGSGDSTPSIGTGDAVAIVRVEGPIISDDGTEFSAGAATSGVVIADLRSAAEDPTVKAIVLRVDSPGGTVTGATQIYEVVRELEKPVVVSMAALAASGGYQISAPADYIFARPDTFTGSIGVILTVINAEELANELGVDVVLITSGPNKALGSLWESLTTEQQDIFEELIDESHEAFVRIVADGRNMNLDTVRELADGRIYSGRQAVDNGLVDELGNLQDAIAKAAELGGINGEPRIVEYERLPDLSQFLSGLSTRLNRTETDQILDLVTEFTTPTLEYRYVGPGTN